MKRVLRSIAHLLESCADEMEEGGDCVFLFDDEIQFEFEEEDEFEYVDEEGYLIDPEELDEYDVEEEGEEEEEFEFVEDELE